jgi:hypothetical protein
MRKNEYVEYDVRNVITLDDDKLEKITNEPLISRLPDVIRHRGFVKFFGTQSFPVQVGDTVQQWTKTVVYIEDEISGCVVDLEPTDIKYVR